MADQESMGPSTPKKDPEEPVLEGTTMKRPAAATPKAPKKEKAKKTEETKKTPKAADKETKKNPKAVDEETEKETEKKNPKAVHNNYVHQSLMYTSSQVQGFKHTGMEVQYNFCFNSNYVHQSHVYLRLLHVTCELSQCFKCS